LRRLLTCHVVATSSSRPRTPICCANGRRRPHCHCGRTCEIARLAWWATASELTDRRQGGHLHLTICRPWTSRTALSIVVVPPSSSPAHVSSPRAAHSVRGIESPRSSPGGQAAAHLGRAAAFFMRRGRTPAPRQAPAGAWGRAPGRAPGTPRRGPPSPSGARFLRPGCPPRPGRFPASRMRQPTSPAATASRSAETSRGAGSWPEASMTAQCAGRPMARSRYW
jgi:hypothetical protein